MASVRPPESRPVLRLAALAESVRWTAIFVGLVIRSDSMLLGSLCCGALPLFGSGPRFLDLTLVRCARLVPVLDRIVTRDLQFGLSMLLFLGGSGVGSPTTHGPFSRPELPASALARRCYRRIRGTKLSLFRSYDRGRAWYHTDRANLNPITATSKSEGVNAFTRGIRNVAT